MQEAEKKPKPAEQASEPSLPTKAVATVFFAGYVPAAPGTAGSIAALIPLMLFPSISFPALLVLTIVIFIIGTAASKKFEEAYGEDPQVVVIDEFAGMWITMLFVPITWFSLTAGFILFRLFDILKPPPLRRLEKLPKGWGIMLDDAGAGIYAGVVLLLINEFI